MTEYDDEVPVDPARPFRMSPNCMRSLTKVTGMTLTEILQGDDDALRWQAVNFGVLHKRLSRLGHMPDAGELWERAGDADVVLESPEQLDPTVAALSTISPPSATTGE